MDAELAVSVEYTLDCPLDKAAWRVRYIADHAHHRHVVHIHDTEPTLLDKGVHRFSYKLENIDVKDLQANVLLNVGLLVFALCSGEEEVLQVSMVTLVEMRDGIIYRHVLNPLE